MDRAWTKATTKGSKWQTAELLLEAVVRAGGSRHVVATTAVALTRFLEEPAEADAAWSVPGVRERLSAAAPAVAQLCQGQAVPAATRLRRNVALHAVQLPHAAAPLSAWRRAQRGPRLGGAAELAVETALAAEEPPAEEAYVVLPSVPLLFDLFDDGDDDEALVPCVDAAAGAIAVEQVVFPVVDVDVTDANAQDTVGECTQMLDIVQHVLLRIQGELEANPRMWLDCGLNGSLLSVCERLRCLHAASLDGVPSEAVAVCKDGVPSEAVADEMPDATGIASPPRPSPSKADVPSEAESLDCVTSEAVDVTWSDGGYPAQTTRPPGLPPPAASLASVDSAVRASGLEMASSFVDEDVSGAKCTDRLISNLGGGWLLCQDEVCVLYRLDQGADAP